MKLPHLSLHTRISLVLTALAASLLLVLAGLWLKEARGGIHEEIEAATRVSEQWLRAVAGEMQALPAAALPGRVLAVVRPLGRVRANALEVLAADGSQLYLSPPPTYKAGRSVPAWFAALLRPNFVARSVPVGDLQLVLHPDPSRALIDAWDDLCAMAGWAVLLLVMLFAATRRALDRALRPLEQVMTALDSTGKGRFDTRLPAFATPELGRLSRAFNGMADRLGEAVEQNVRLESDREVARRMQAGLEEERRVIARELHDELAQGITAVRALAGAIVQRTTDESSLHIPARSIVAVTGEMQDGVRRILYRLRPATTTGLAETLGRMLANWGEQHPAVKAIGRLEIGDLPVADAVAATVIRIVQEGLTNVARHAGASQVELAITRDLGWLQLNLTDNGQGRSQRSSQAGCGLGLTGMAERIAALGGHLQLESPPDGGFRIYARLPETIPHPLPEELE
jgi:two-component system, NarL family, sensor histidine kinase UhpB